MIDKLYILKLRPSVHPETPIKEWKISQGIEDINIHVSDKWFPPQIYKNS